ncbi:MAG: hypothetical protein WC531_03540 [Candidatus Paceibacterota bacterium]
MRYLTNSFWRMVMGLVAVLALGLIFLVACQIYNPNSNNNVSPENYVAGSQGE